MDKDDVLKEQLSLLDVEFLARPIPIYIIGDSHVLIYSNLLFQEKKIFKTNFITRSKYCSGLTANNFTDGDGKLNPILLQALSSEFLLDDNEQGVHLAGARDVLVNDPTLVFFCGDIDLRYVFLRQLGPTVDFHLPFNVTDLEQLSSLESPTIIPYALVLEQAKKMLHPLLIGLQKLKTMGFQNVFIHNLPPPTLDEAAYQRLNGYSVPASLRYKATILFNLILEDYANQLELKFLNIWDEVTINNQRNSVFNLDAVHLNKQAAYLSLKKLIAFQFTTAIKNIESSGWQGSH